MGPGSVTEVRTGPAPTWAARGPARCDRRRILAWCPRACCGNISEIATRRWAVRSTMMDVPLTVTSIMRYGTTTFAGKEVVTNTGDGVRHRTYAETGRRCARLANALNRLGIDGGQRGGPFLWENGGA